MILYRNILAVAAFIIFFSGLPLILFVFGFVDFPPALWVIVFGIMALPLVILSALRGIKHVLPVVIWCFALICISLAWVFTGRQSALAFEALQYRFITVGTLLSVAFLFLNTSSLVWARVSVAAWLLLSVVLNIYDLLDPYTIGFYPGRGSGVYLNPNISAEALVLGMLLCVTLVSPVWRTSFVLLIGIGVLATLSRAGLIAYGVGVLGLLVFRLVPTRSFFITLPSAILLAVIAIATQSWDTILVGWDKEGIISSSEIFDAIEERITWFLDPSTPDEAITERVEGAEQAWRLFSEHPLLGGGTGTNFHTWVGSDEFRKPGPHNIFLWLVVDHGILGALIFPALLLSVGWGADGETRKLAIIMTFVLLLIGFSSHNLLDNRHVLFSLGVLSAMVAQGKKRSWEKSGERRDVALNNTASCVSA